MNKRKIAICFGGYCPLHQGHMDVIMKAKKENDVCFVVVCGYDNEPRGWEINLNLEERTEIIKTFFNDDEQIIVLSVNDTELGLDESMSDNNWTIWQNKIKQLVFSGKHWRGHYIKYDVFEEDECDFTWYVAEPFYKTCIEKNNVFNANVVLIDRVNPVSGTLVRANPVKYWGKITELFKPYLCHNVLVVGTASEGKSTLVKDISRYFDIPYCWEYGRTYMEDNGLTDIDLKFDDFKAFLYGQTKLGDEMRTLSNNGLFISDTDNCVTLMYALAYAEDPNIEINQHDYDKLHAIAKDIQKKSKFKWNKIFILPPNKNFVNDGTRYMGQSSIDERMKNFEKLQKLLNEFYPEVSKTYLNGSFLENFYEVKNYINSVIEG